MCSTPGLTWSRLARKRSSEKSRWGSRSILLTSTSSHARNISGYFSGLSSPSVTDEIIARLSSPTRNSAGHTRLPTFSITSRSISSSAIAPSAERTMLASRWHSPPKPGSVLSWVTGTCRADRRSASNEPWTSPSSTPTRTAPRPSISTRSSSAVLPAPGALIRLTTRTPARSKSARLARAIVSFASSTSVATLTLLRCTSPPPHPPPPRSSPPSAPRRSAPPRPRPAQRGQRNEGSRSSHSSPHAQRSRARARRVRSRAPSQTVPRATISK